MRTLLLAGLAGLLAGLAPESAIRAQEPAPFSTLALSVQGGADVGRDPLRDYWQPGPALGVRLASPFHWGTEVAGSALRLHYAAHDASQPDFDAYLLSIEWLAPLLRGPLGLQAGLVAGNFLNRFPGLTESEFFAGAALRATAFPESRLSLGAQLSRTRVFTMRPITQDMLTVGGTLRFDTPGWLRPFFE